jgi:hypothetical protein
LNKDDYNPYQAPGETTDPDFAGAPAELIRREHLSHEASIRLIGSLYLIIGSVVSIPSVGLLIRIFGTGQPQQNMAIGAWWLIAAGVFALVLGFATHRLNRGARAICAFFSAAGMLFVIPFGAIINGCIIYLLYSKKGKMVFPEDYKQVIRDTPHVRYQTSIVVWIFLLLLLGRFGMPMLLRFGDP